MAPRPAALAACAAAVAAALLPLDAAAANRWPTSYPTVAPTVSRCAYTLPLTQPSAECIVAVSCSLQQPTCPGLAQWAASTFGLDEGQTQTLIYNSFYQFGVLEVFEGGGTLATVYVADAAEAPPQS